MDLADVREYVRLRRREDELDGQLKGVKEEADRLEGALKEQFSTDGVDRISVDGTTVYLHRQIWAKAAPGSTKEMLARALEEAGLGHFVYETVNYSTISAYVRDLEREEDELPEQLRDHLTVSEVFRLRTRRDS